MEDAGVDPVAIDVFAHYYRLVESGETGMIPESTIEPVDMPTLADVDVARAGATDGLGRHRRRSSSTAASARRWAWTGPSRCSRSATG